MGTGNETDITFHANSQTNFTFPFTMEFSTNMASSTAILTDLAQKCGVNGGAVQDITINLDITVRVRDMWCMDDCLTWFFYSAWITHPILRGVPGGEHSSQFCMSDIRFGYWGTITRSQIDSRWPCPQGLISSLASGIIWFLLDEDVARQPDFVHLLG